MFFSFIFEENPLQKTAKPATSLSLRLLIKNYPSLERSAKISALFPPAQIFFTIHRIYLFLIIQNTMVERVIRWIRVQNKPDKLYFSLINPGYRYYLSFMLLYTTKSTVYKKMLPLISFQR